MRRTSIILLAAIIAAASTAQAAPRFGAHKASAQGSGSHRAQADVPLIYSVLHLFGLKFSTATVPTTDHRSGDEVCEEGKKAESDKRKKKSAGSAGPEPVPLAF